MPSRMLTLISVFTFAALPGLGLSGPSSRFSLRAANPDTGVNPNAQGATPTVTGNSGPNGEEDWMNSGIKGSGWTAPFLDLDSIVKIDVAAFYSGAGARCKQYESAFQTIGEKYHIDPVVLASIAMQESSCNAGVSGGLMQVYCGNYENKQCTNDIEPNVDAGAKYLRTQLDSSNNNIIKALGLYNGWFTATESYGKNGGRGLTEDYPCQGGVGNGGPQNLDYLQQMLNGWLVGRDPQGVDSFIGSYHCQNCKNGALC